METRPEVDFSVIIPARNEAQYIGACLDSLLRQDYHGPVEIIVIDGLSEDGTAAIVEGYAACEPCIRLIDNPRRITPVAFNLGVRAARGRYLLTVGAHWYLPDDYLSAIAAAFERHPEADCLGGKIVRVVKNETGHSIEAARASRIGGGLSTRNYLETETLVQQANIAYIWRREVFQRIGLFDERLIKNQDNELNLRALRAGLHTLYAPQVQFYYRAPDSYRKLYWQMYGYASYIPMIQMKHHALVYAKYALPLLGLIAWFSLAVLAGLQMLPVAIPVALVITYLAVTGAGALATARTSGRLSRGALIWRAYWTIHLATALGYGHGLLRLLNLPATHRLWRDGDLQSP